MTTQSFPIYVLFKLPALGSKLKVSAFAIWPALTLAAVLGVEVRTYSQTTVVANPHQPWLGFMNAFSLLGPSGSYSAGNFEFGSAWGTFALRANPDAATGTNYLVITPCTNVWNPADPYWVNPNGTPNQWMDANYYVQDDTLAGQVITFQGSCLSNTLSGGAYSQAFIKNFSADYVHYNKVAIPLVAGQTFNLTSFTGNYGPGEHVQYGFETQGPDMNPLYNTNYVVITYDNSSVSLLPIPGLMLFEGQKATFDVTNLGSAATSLLWTYSPYYPDLYAGNVLSDGLQASGSTISGSATSTLIVSNVTLGDVGYYTVMVANDYGAALGSTTLGVHPVSDQITTNMLIDPDFEGNTFARFPTAGWIGYNGAGFQSTNDYYNLTTHPVVVRDGTNCVHTYSYGPNSYNGVYQDHPTVPGTIYTGNAWFFTPSVDPITGAGACYLEVQFHNAGGGVLRQYKSASVTTNSPVDTWVNLMPTNIYAGDFSTFLGTAPYMVAPPGSTKVRFQITHAADTGGSVYVDSTDLRLRAPVATTSANGNNIQISFPTLYGPIYQVLYKTNLMDDFWKTNSTTITGDGTIKTLSDPKAAKTRFYIVNTR